MGVTSEHTLASAVVAGSSTFTMRCMSDTTLEPGTETVLGHAAGEFRPTYVSVMNIAPRWTGSTMEISRILDATGIRSLALPTSTTYTTLSLYYAKFQDLSTRASGSSHIKMVVNKGMMVPRSITVSQGQPAVLNFDVVTLYDGTNAPLVFSTSQALPTAVAFDEMHTLGPIYFNGAQLTGVQSMTFDFGVDIEVTSADGEVYPRFAAITQTQPFIDFTTTELPDWVTQTLAGTVQGATDSVIYLSAMAEGSTRGGAGAHISFTIDEGMIVQRPVSVTNNQKASPGFRFLLTYDLTADIAVYAKNASLP
jgi:hypothetical protein